MFVWVGQYSRHYLCFALSGSGMGPNQPNAHIDGSNMVGTVSLQLSSSVCLSGRVWMSGYIERLSAVDSSEDRGQEDALGW